MKGPSEKQRKQNRIIEIDYQLTAAAALIEENADKVCELLTKISELNLANARHSYDIKKMNIERARLVEEQKP